MDEVVEHSIFCNILKGGAKERKIFGMELSSWTKASWRAFSVAQQPKWPDNNVSQDVVAQLSTLPALVFAGETRALREQLAEVAEGHAFVLQAGDCAERFARCHGPYIHDLLKVILQMAVILAYAGEQKIVTIGRFAGQYAGVGCEMDAILEIANRHNIAVVEDNAHGLFGKYKGKSLGTFGCLATQSFHETKNITCGEGGALLINDPQYSDRAEIIWEKGTDRSRFFRGQVDKYSWVDIGSSYLPSDILAAFLYAQLEMSEQIQARRQRIWTYYFEHLQEWARASNVQMPFVPAHCEHPAHLFYLIMPSFEARQAMIAHLNAHHINAVFHYLPLHLSTMGQQFGGKPGDCPVTEDFSDRLLRLPFYSTLTETEQQRIIETIQQFNGAKSRGSL